MSYLLCLIYLLLGAVGGIIACLFNDASAYPPTNRVLLMGVPPLVAVAGALAIGGFVLTRKLRTRLSRGEYLAHSITFALLAAAGVAALLLG